MQVLLAQALGGDIRLGKSGEHVSLSKAEERAHAYVSADPINRYLSPFGLRTSRGDPTFDLFRGALVDALRFVSKSPKR